MCCFAVVFVLCFVSCWFLVWCVCLFRVLCHVCVFVLLLFCYIYRYTRMRVRCCMKCCHVIMSLFVFVCVAYFVASFVALFVGGTKFDGSRMINLMRARSRVWKLEVEQIVACSEPQGVNLLDINIALCSSGQLRTKIFEKLTLLYQPLAPSSLHAPHVHVAWPHSMVSRAFSLCSHSADSKAEVFRLKRLLEMRCGCSYVSNLFACDSKEKPPKPAPQPDDHCTRIIQRMGLRKLCRSILEIHAPAMLRDYGHKAFVSLAFSLYTRHLGVQLFHSAVQK